MTEFVEIVEVGPRDGLQNEARAISVTKKIEFVDLLSGCGFKRIETGAFVHPARVPQMAGSAEVFAGIRRQEGVRYTALVPNAKGYARAKAAGADEVAVFVSASEGFSEANLNCSIGESLEHVAAVSEASAADNVPVRGYISCVTDCPYDGPTAPSAVARVATSLRSLGIYEISLGDTIGKGTPETVVAMLEEVISEAPTEMLAGHFHDTAGRALANVDAALGLGVRVFDGSVGGLGGCPFAPGASGNLATEALASHLKKRGYQTGLDTDRLREAASFARTLRTEG